MWRVQSLERAPSWQPDPKWKRAESAITLGFTGRKNPALERRSRMAQKSCARRRHGPSAGRPGQCGTDSGRARRVHLNHPGLQACGPGVRWPWPSGAGRRRAASAAFFCWILGRPGACKSVFFGFARAFLWTLQKFAKCYEGRYHKPYSSVEWLFWVREERLWIADSRNSSR